MIDGILEVLKQVVGYDPDRKPRPLPRFRFSVIIPVAFYVVSFFLTFMIVRAGTKPGMMEDMAMLTMNTSRLGQNLIQITPVNVTATPTATAKSNKPTGTSKSSSPTSTSEPTSNLTSSFSSWVDGIFDGITNTIATTVDPFIASEEQALIKELTNYLGVSDFYKLYLGSICHGNITDPTSANATYVTTNCSTYSEAVSGISNFSIPSSVVLLSTNISVPLLKTLSGGGGVISGGVTGITAVMYGLLITSLVGAGLSAVLALLTGLKPDFRIIFYSGLGISIITLLVHIIGVIITLAIGGGGSYIMNSIGGDIGLQSNAGGKYFGFAFGSLALLLISSVYWIVIWFVEYRQGSFRSRRRRPEEMGYYRGVLFELLDDIRGTKEEKAELPNRAPVRSSYSMI
ncbi:hypothetical protein BP6252_13797 [Coleophoma cylindrospora]|uniref:Sur7 protein n=1 Tax=Coleophoma cylindrospora TaxID=1849047 RepID=A0A3D8Q6P5_9HELO|nr:hypothetical protein BP6252_13797 [Coleophoma cylindrospora]